MEVLPGGRRAATTIAELLLGGPDDQVALRGDHGDVDRRALREQVAARRRELALDGRQVVVLGGRTGAEWIVTYLALLADGHVPLLVGEQRAAIEQRWQPGAVIQVAGSDVHIERRLGAEQPELHPELALLLSTSGSTGSPKLVRLSHRNLIANATAIADALSLVPDDVAATSLPLHYCYGLSVVHSHLAAGASIVPVDASVVDPCFAAAIARHGVTTVAGVPHTFELLEAAGPERIRVPSLRLLTVAGGGLDPSARQRWAERSARWGVDLAVMYGQTEATARLSVLDPAELATAAPTSVGRPVAGGSFAIRPVPERADAGEVIYRGPNVMLGYAEAPEDLALGATVAELATGDLGRIDPATGHLHLLGRRSRFVKPFGLRIALDEVEQALAADLGTIAVAGDDRGLVVAAPGRDRAAVTSLVAVRTGLPEAAVAVVEADDLPRTASGKVDHPALLQRGRAAPVGTAVSAAARPSEVLAAVLGRPTIPPEASFVAAGGDSLSYVEATVRLEQLLGQLPDDWHHLPVGELDRAAPARPQAQLDTTVLLRTIGICTVVATHMALAYWPGGAHLLLAVAGYNLSRFQLGLHRGRDRARAAARTVARAAVPAAAVAAVVVATTDRYGWTTIAMVNNYLGPRGHDGGHWHLWFIEAFIQLVVVATALLAIPWVARLDRRWPYLVPLALLGGAIWLRQATWFGIDDPYNLRFRTHAVAIFFVLGWLVHRSRTPLQRLATTALCLAVIPGTFGLPQREWYIAGGLLLLLWCPRLPFPRQLARPVALVAAASMWILISHFHVWPVLDEHLPIGLAYPGTIAAGVAVAALAAALERSWSQRWARARHRRAAEGGSGSEVGAMAAV